MTYPATMPLVGRSYDHDKPYYWNLESLRFLCAILVAILHVPWASHLGQLALIKQSWLFVDFFFVLSGFVIAENYLGEIHDKGSAKRFMLRRLFRLYPLHILTLLAAGALIAARLLVSAPISATGPAAVDGEWWYLVPLNVLLLHGMGFADREILNGPSWSISSELLAYAVFAVVCLATRSTRLRLLTFGVIAAASVALLAALNGSDGVQAHVDHNFLRCLFGFGLGVLASASRRRWPARGSSMSSGWTLAGWIILTLAMVGYVGRDQTIGYVVPLLFAVMIYLFAVDRGSGISRCLEWRPLQHGGKISYSVYMNHTIIVMILSFVLKVFHVPVDDPQNIWLGDICLIGYLLMVVLVSNVTFKYVEQPWRVKGRRLVR